MSNIINLVEKQETVQKKLARKWKEITNSYRDLLNACEKSCSIQEEYVDYVSMRKECLQNLLLTSQGIFIEINSGIVYSPYWKNAAKSWKNKKGKYFEEMYKLTLEASNDTRRLESC